MNAEQHAMCQPVIRDMFAERGCEVTVSIASPLIDNGFATSITCPHGVRLWMEPTGDQRADWSARIVRDLS